MTKQIAIDAPAHVIARVDAYAAENGRLWRSKLRALWMSGRDTGALREARNYIGPSGLDNFKPGCMTPEAVEPAASVVGAPPPAMVPQPCQQQQARARGRALQPARGERRYVTVRDTENGDVHRVLTSVARVGVAVVIFTPSNRHRAGALGGMLITHDDIRKAWVFNDEAEARRMLSRNGAPGERVIRAELISDPAAA